jgi:hypothetical protein
MGKMANALPRLLVLLACLGSAAVAQADAADSEELEDTLALPEGRHRIDVGVSLRDAYEGNILVMVPAYSLALSSGLRVLASTSYAYLESDPDLPAASLDEPTSSGLGDSILQAQYAPGVSITASPWIPDTVGLTGTLLMPTGNAEKGLGSDNWEFEVSLGWSYHAAGSLWLIPGAYYLTSISEGSLGVPVEEFGISVELRWLFDSGYWVGYRPDLVHDFEADAWADDHMVVLGKMFGNGFGLVLEYGRADRLEKTSRRDDYVALLTFYYQFGRAP